MEQNQEQINDNIKTEVINQVLFDIEYKCDLKEELLKKIKSILGLNLYNYNIVPKKYEVVVQSRTNEVLWKKFLVTKKAENLSNKTLQYYKNTLEQFSLVIKKNFLTVTSDDIRFFLLKKEQENVTPCTLDNLRRNIRSFFSWMQNEALRHDNPSAKVNKIKGERTDKTAFNRIEIEKIRSACVTPIEKAIIETLLSSAMRAKELTNMKLSDINFEKREVKIIRKGNKLGYAFLNAKAIVALQEYFKTREPGAGEYIWIRNSIEKKMFEPDPEDHYLQQHIYGIIKTIGRRAEVDDVHPHKFRRTVATIALQKGMAIEEVQQLLGHSSINTTMLYTKIDREDIIRKHNKILD